MSDDRSLQRRLFTDTVTVGAFTALGKLAGALKIVITARYFGTADALDAYLIAFVLPAFLADVIAGCLTPSIVPVLVRAKTRDGIPGMHSAAQSALMFGIALMMFAAAALAMLGPFAMPLLGSSFTPGKLSLTIKLFLILLFWLPMSACLSTWRAVLNVSGSFALPAVAPAATPILTIASLWICAPRWGIAALPIGTLAGVVAETIILAIAVRRLGFPVAPAWKGWTPDVASVSKQYLPLTAGAMITSSSVIVDQAMAATLGAGNVSALVYGNKFVLVLLAIAGTAAGTAALPMFSQLAAAGEWARLRKLTRNYVGLAFAITVPAVALLIWISEPMVRILLERGAFDASATHLVARIQQYALLQAPFAIALAIIIRLAAALEASSILARAAVIGFIVNIAGDVLFARWFGIAGIALSTAVVQLASFFVLTFLLRRRGFLHV